MVQIGTVESEGPEQLHGVVHSRLLPGGGILVVDLESAEIRIFGEDGLYRTAIGRRGDGPGEFRSLWHAYPMGGDSLLAVDLYRSVSVFDERGTYVRRFVPGGVVGERQGAPLGQFGDGTLLFMRYQPEDPTWTGVRRTQVELVRIDRRGEIATSFGLFDEQTIRNGGGAPYLLGPWGKAAAGPSSLHYGPGDRFELHEIGMDGGTMRLVRMNLPQRAVTPADVDAHLRSMRERAREGGQEEMFDRRYADAEAAGHFPAHSDIRVDDEGYVWVEEYQPPDERVAGTWYVFGPEGEYLGGVTTPAGFTVHQIARSRVIGRWTDELGVEYVRVYGIENRPRPAR